MRDLAAYMKELKSDAVYIWLRAIAKSARNGNATLSYRDLTIENRMTKQELMRVWNPYAAQKFGVIKILLDTDSTIVINFRKGTKQEVTPAMQRKALKLESPEKLLLAATNSESAPSLLPQTKKNSDASESASVPSVLAKNGTFAITHKFMKEEILADYIEFFKHNQMEKQYLAGVPVNSDSMGIRPKIDGTDYKYLKKIVAHFSNVLQDFKIERTEKNVRAMFQQMYANWHLLGEFVQKGITPQAINYNINTIVTELTKLKNGKKTDSKRESELSNKINRAGTKDYSHLARTRKESD